MRLGSFIKQNQTLLTWKSKTKKLWLVYHTDTHQWWQTKQKENRKCVYVNQQYFKFVNVVMGLKWESRYFPMKTIYLPLNETSTHQDLRQFGAPTALRLLQRPGYKERENYYSVNVLYSSSNVLANMVFNIGRFSFCVGVSKLFSTVHISGVREMALTWNKWKGRRKLAK